MKFFRAGFIEFPGLPLALLFMRGHSLAELTSMITVLLISWYIYVQYVMCTDTAVVIHICIYSSSSEPCSNVYVPPKKYLVCKQMQTVIQMYLPRMHLQEHLTSLFS